MSITKPSRILPLDIYRSLFVIMAALSHAFGQLGMWDYLAEDTATLYRLFTRGATPGLIILFGVMLELVYVRHARRDGLTKTSQRLLYRSFLCYCAFVTIALAGYLGGNSSLKSLIGAVTLLGTSLFANIFKIYLFLLLAAIPLIALRIYRGVIPLLLVMALVWVVDALLLRGVENPFVNAAFPLGMLEHSMDFFFGVGDSWGPSILHSLSLVAFGMIMANVFTTRSWSSIAYLTVLTLVALAQLAFEIGAVGFSQFMSNIDDISVYRKTNDPVYFAYGITYSMLALGLSWAAYWIMNETTRKPLTYIGSRTFPFFLTINILIVLTPRGLPVTSLAVGWCIFGLYVAATCLIMHAWESRIEDHPAAAYLRGRLDALAKAIVLMGRGWSMSMFAALQRPQS